MIRPRYVALGLHSDEPGLLEGENSVAAIRDGIYLSGWEYNRLLQRDPITRRNSALPAEILWNGAAPLWLFRKVFCTQEAVDNEWRAYELLGWPTGRIFTELCNREIITPLDWTDLSRATQALVRQKHVRDLAPLSASRQGPAWTAPCVAGLLSASDRISFPAGVGDDIAATKATVLIQIRKPQGRAFWRQGTSAG